MDFVEFFSKKCAPIVISSRVAGAAASITKTIYLIKQKMHAIFRIFCVRYLEMHFCYDG